MGVYFRSPWSHGLKITTAVFLLVLALAAFHAGPIGASIIVAVVVLAAVFAVRGYSVSEGQLQIHHLGWSTRIDLSRLDGAAFRPEALAGSLRLGAIGGLFGSVGFFLSRELGSFRGYITDRARAVVLDVGGERVLVSPDRPDEFVAAVTFHRFYEHSEGAT